MFMPICDNSVNAKSAHFDMSWSKRQTFEFHLPGTSESHQITYNVSVKCTKFRHSKRCSGWDKGRKTFVPPVYSSALGKKRKKKEKKKKRKKVNSSTCRAKKNHRHKQCKLSLLRSRHTSLFNTPDKLVFTPLKHSRQHFQFPCLLPQRNSTSHNYVIIILYTYCPYWQWKAFVIC